MHQEIKFPILTILFGVLLSSSLLILGVFEWQRVFFLVYGAFFSALNIFFYGLLLSELVKLKKNPFLIFLFFNLKIITLGLLFYFLYQLNKPDLLVAGCGILCLIPAAFFCRQDSEARLDQ